MNMPPPRMKDWYPCTLPWCPGGVTSGNNDW